MANRDLHTEALCWLRFGKRLPVVCTEAGPWYADVLGLSTTMAVEVEVKKSKSDLLAEFRKKQTKHSAYAHAEEGAGAFVPNYLYFYVPQVLGEYTVKVIEEKCPKAGVAILTDTEGLSGRNTEVIRKPVKLRSKPPGQKLIRQAVMRMGSELCGRYVALGVLQDQVTSQLHIASRGAVQAAVRASGTLDCEDRLGDLRQRAEELAFAVEGVADFDALDKTQRQKWMVAAERWLEAQYQTSKGWDDAPFRI